jgi:hypothetical protein
VLHIPGIKANLITTSTIIGSNHDIIDQKGATLRDKGTNNILLSTSCSSNNMQEVKLKVLSAVSFLLVTDVGRVVGNAAVSFGSLASCCSKSPHAPGDPQP